MRAQARRIRHEEEEESAFVSMTDMTVGFLFIMMILLAFFASQIRDPEQETVPRGIYEDVVAQRNEAQKEIKIQTEKIAELRAQIDRLLKQNAVLKDIISELRQVIFDKGSEIQRLNAELERLRQIDPLEEYLSRIASVRREVLLQLRDAIRLDFPEIQVELSEESDALRFQGEGLFESGSSNLINRKREIVGRLAQRLDEVLPCFTIGERSQFSKECNAGFVMIEAVQIEGHTDNVGTDFVNRTLSTARANTTFFAMTNAAPTVMEHLNLKSQPVLSVAAYGPDRPVTTNETPEGRATNRRIDLRFIMVTPPDTDGIATIRSALETLSGNTE